ncbi:MAG: hypothetical protein LIO70_09185 [Clostridiales bacterium]|nr:hypothetical protein [Clostridiales bacterium]
MQKKEISALSLASEMSIPSYHLECAADLAFCLSVALSTGNVGEEQAGNALLALYNHLSDLYNEQEGIIDLAYDRPPEGDGETEQADVGDEGSATR